MASAEPRFIHLKIHSDYSIIDGLAKIDQIINNAVALQMPSIAITDYTNLYGVIKFYCLAHSAGIKPIIGADFMMENDSYHNQELSELTLLASNNIGYKNLIMLISAAYKRGYGSYGPLIHRDWLIDHNEGLILLSGASRGDVGRYLLCENPIKVQQCVSFYRKYFPDRYYLELVRTGRPGEERYIHAAVQLALDQSIPVVATNDVRFINPDDFDAHEIRVAIHDGFTLDYPKRKKKYSKKQYMRTEQEMCELFSELPEALVNSVEIARRCNVTIRLGEYFLPTFPTGSLSPECYLIMLAEQGLEDRLKVLFPDVNIRNQKRAVYDERLGKELKIINHIGFPSYFLIVMEFIQWAKNNDITVGPGRGSGAGSLVAYALKITDIDPLKFDLLFERFLNPERISMPDFDIDFCMEKRDLVIDHVANIYGRDAVSQIITFGTMAAKAAIRDVGRVLGYPYGFVDRISKLIPTDLGMTIAKAFTTTVELRSLYNMDADVRLIIDMARKLEGVTRNASKHAGGVVIAPTKITDFSPMYYDAEGNHPVTQFDKNDVECAGLVKFDFLGLRTLTIINVAMKMINTRRVCQGLGKIDITAIPLNDEKSFSMLQSSETTGVFQLESYGMKDLIKRLCPVSFEDMIALVALFRPGPLKSGMVDNFIDRKHGREKIYYPDRKWQHELLRPILDSTYGIILYQEQVMQIAQVLAGYTLGGADMLRRAIGKKNPEEMKKQRSIFKSGAERRGIDGTLAMKIFDLVEKFAGYGFNKSHSVAYALVSYQTLWLKTHYPAEFMASVLTADMDDIEKIVLLVDECFRMKLKMLQPDINIGEYHFHVNESGHIVYGLGAIKGVGKSTIREIIQARNKGGSFIGLSDLCARTDIKKINRRVIEQLILSGAFDRLGPNRADLIASLHSILKIADQQARAAYTGQGDMFGISMQIPKTNKRENRSWTEQCLLEAEKETLGLYLTGHPITKYLKELEHYSDLVRIKDIDTTHIGRNIITIAGIILSDRIVVTNKGNRFCVCTIDDRYGRLNVIFFTNTLEKYYALRNNSRLIIVQGHISFDHFHNELRMIARQVLEISEIREKYVIGVTIIIPEKQIKNLPSLEERLRLVLEKHHTGRIPMRFYCKLKNRLTPCFIKTTWSMKLTECLLNDLRSIFGMDHVELEFHY